MSQEEKKNLKETSVDKDSHSKERVSQADSKTANSKEAIAKKDESKDSQTKTEAVSKAEDKMASHKVEEAKAEPKEGSPKPVSAKKDESKDSQTESKADSKPEEKATSKKTDEPKESSPQKTTIKLNGLYAFKVSMTRFYDDKGGSLPVTALKYEPSYVSQIKTKEKDSYSAVQMAFKAQKNKRCSKPLIQHLKKAGFKEGARFVKEIRQELIPDNVKVGDEVSIQSLEKGDLVKISAVSKGKGFTGVMKRWNFAGGRASHGSKAHRRTGSIGQCTQPGRVFPGRKMPGRHGFQKVSRLKVPIVEVLPEEGLIFVKGQVPGARNTLVSLQKTQ